MSCACAHTERTPFECDQIKEVVRSVDYGATVEDNKKRRPSN